MKLKAKFVLSVILSLLLLLSQSGCTYFLWTNYDLEAYKEPAQTPNLKLFKSDKRSDYLVVYDEYSERHNAVHTRAYWLNKNENLVENRHAPVFEQKISSCSLPSIPVFYSVPEDTNQNFFAIYETNSQSLALFSGGRQVGSYDLPIYNDGRGRIEKIALTPVAVSVDATIVGACLAIFWAYGEEGASFPAGK